MKNNVLLNTDSYKVGMWALYPPKTQNVFSYIESRGGIHRETVFFGLQAFIKEYLLEPLTMDDVEEAIEFWKLHGENVNEENLRKLVTKHNGYLPVRIRAVEEGKVVPVKNVLVTIEATDEEFYWLPTWLETSLLRAIWYPTTVATNSFQMRQIIKEYLEKTGTVEAIDWKLHDFGARGANSYEASGLGAMSHLVNFNGTDSIAGTVFARRYYNAKKDVAGSIPATEHSISTSWGRDEASYVRNNIEATKAFPIFANVADTYDVFAFVNMLGKELREDVLELGKQGRTMVVRPDSGDPVKTPIQIIEMLLCHFGSEINAKGYKVLPPFLRVIQGDGIGPKEVKAILEGLEAKGISADNIAFGMGGKLLGSPQRDDQKFAMKASAVKIDGQWKGVSKDPVTDPGKRSKEGRLTLVENQGLGSISVQTVEEKYVGNRKDLMKTVFENGKLVSEIDFDKVRQNARI